MTNTLYLTLLIATFALHYSFVLLLLGTPIIAFCQQFRRGDPSEGAHHFLKHNYPVCISLTITTGVAPLLFSQTLFHEYFYQTFINMFPLPLAILFVLTLFFYNSYLIQRWERCSQLLTCLQILFLVVIVLFFSSLFNGIVNPQSLTGNFWRKGLPPLYWNMLPVHFFLGVIGSAVFFALKGVHVIFRSLILFSVGLVMGCYREWQRNEMLQDFYPEPLTSSIDPTFYLFILSIAVMVSVLYRSCKLAKLID